MAFALVNNTITQTGTDTNGDGLVGLGFTKLTLQSTDADDTIDTVIFTQDDGVVRRIDIEGTWTRAANETYYFGEAEVITQADVDNDPTLTKNESGGLIEIKSGGTFNNGAIVERNSQDSVTNQAGIIFTDTWANQTHFQNRSDILIESGGTFNNYAGISMKMGFRYTDGSAGDLFAWVDVNQGQNNPVVHAFEAADLVVDCTFSGQYQVISFKNNPTTTPIIRGSNIDEFITNRYQDSLLILDGLDSNATRFDFLINSSANDNATKVNNPPFASDGLPKVYTFNNEFGSNQRHKHVFNKPDMKVTVTDASGAALENALVYIRDYDNDSNGRVDFTYQQDGTTTTFLEDFTDDRVYVDFTDSSGEVTFDILTRAAVSNTTNSLGTTNHRSKDGDRSDKFDIYVHKAGYARSVAEVVMAGPTVEPNIALLPDASFTNTETAALALTTISNANDHYDAAWLYQHSLEENYGNRLDTTNDVGCRYRSC